MPDIISRQEAIEQGKNRYFTGKPCVYGHIAERNTKNKNCMDCNRIGKNKRNEKLREHGEVRYFNGTPCKKGHIAEKYVANNRCVVCHREERLKRYHALKYNKAPKFPKYGIDYKEPVITMLFAELATAGLTLEEISEKSRLSLNTLLHLRRKDAPYGSRMTTINQLAYAAGATLCLRMADGRIVDPENM